MTVSTDSSNPESAGVRRVGPWRLGDRLGAGAFGTVWSAEDATGRVAVVKLLAQPPGDEVRALSRVSHPAVVRFIDAGTVPVPFVVMSRAQGEPLEGPALPSEARHPLISALADALAACHRAGVVHGDVKPDNVLVNGKRPTLIDFGLAGGEGGTPRYAAPEVLAGQGGGPAADVYSLGLIAWELWHGELPDDDLEWHEALSQRGRRAPQPSEGPSWLQDLLVTILDPDPSKRPTAAALADALAAEGFAPPLPSVDDLRLRADSLEVVQEPVDRAVTHWIEQAGSLTITGPAESGKSHFLRAAANELRALGMPFVVLAPSRPWASVATALADPALPGPPATLPGGTDAIQRAEAAAGALLLRAPHGLRVLVDDLGECDDGTRRTAKALAAAGAAVLVTSEQPPPWSKQVVATEPLSEAQRHLLYEGLLGQSDVERIDEVACRRVTTWREPLLGFVLAAVHAEALVYRRGRWVLDDGALDAIDLAALPGAPVDALPVQSIRLGAVIAMLQPVIASRALQIAATPSAALGPLRQHGFVTGQSTLTCAHLQASRALLAALDDPRSLWRTIVAWHRASGERGPALGWALVGAQDVDGIRADGVEAVRIALELDVRDAAELAEAMAQISASPEVLAARIHAWVRAGSGERARADAEARFATRPPGPDDLPILVAMAQLEDTATEDPEAILLWTRRAREVLGGRPAPRIIPLVEARAHYRSGDHDEAEALCAPLCRIDDVLEAESTVDIEEWLTARGLWGQVLAARDGAETALRKTAIPHSLGEGTLGRAMFDGIQGRLLWMAGRPREAAALTQAAASRRQALSTVDQARLENNAALCWYVAGDVESAVAGWERALLAFEALGAELEILRVEVNLCQGFADLGRWTRAAQAGERALELARVHRAVLIEAIALGNLGDVAAWRRRYREAERLYGAAEGLLTEDDHSQRVELARRQAELAVHRMSPDADVLVDRALSLAVQHDATVERARVLAVRALVSARAQRIEDTRADGQLALHLLRNSEAVGDFALARLWVAEAMLALRDESEARRLATEVRRYAQEFGRAPLRSWADDLLTWSRNTPQDTHHQLERLTELAVRVASRGALGDVLEELASAAVELVDAERAFVILVEGDDLTVAARAGEGADLARPSQSVVRRAISRGREIVVTDIAERADLQRADSVVAMKLKAVMCVPLLLDGVVVGLLYLDSREAPMSSLGDAVALVRSLAAHASVALGNARLTDQVRQQALRVREVAHDLRSPLSGLLMLLEDVVEEAEPLAPADASRAVGDLRHALDLVHSALSTEVPPAVRFPWQSAVRAWLKSLDGQARAAGVELVTDDGGGDGEVRGQPMELRRAVTNVVTNAIKYTPSGAVVTLTVFSDGHCVGLRVDDQGPGVPSDNAERIFHPGVQLAEAQAGYGLGLHIARRICREHAGDVTVTSLPSGSRFEIWLPRA